MVEDRIRLHCDDYLAKAEAAIYFTLGALLSIASLAAIASAGKLLWDGLTEWRLATEALRVLEQLLVALMLVEILHTVRISIRSHFLATEPFLVVGLIASIRRILVLSLEMATVPKEGKWPTDAASGFHLSMIELGLLGLLVLILVFSITLLRRYAPAPKTDGLVSTH